MNDKTIIKPTIGRRVWYWPSIYDLGHLTSKPSSVIAANTPTSGQPCDAGVVYVHSDRMINLSVTDHNGVVHGRTSVTLLRPGEQPMPGCSYATWMDYQIKQAGKVETPEDEQTNGDAEAALQAAFDEALGLLAGAMSEDAAAPGEGMCFGWALEMLKAGYKVARKGWNGKGMWLSLSGTDGMRHVHANNLWSKNIADYARTQPDSCAQVQPCVVMKTATGQIQMGWLASQSDMLAEDWELVA